MLKTFLKNKSWVLCALSVATVSVCCCIVVAFYGSQAIGETPVSPCPERQQWLSYQGNFQQLFSKARSSCSASVSLSSATTSEDLSERSNVTRTFSFEQTGHFNIFVSTQESEFLSRSTGMRSFYLFPRSQNLNFDITESNFAEQNSNSTIELIHFKDYEQREVVLNARLGTLVSMTGYEVVSSQPQINLKNKGGVELKPLPGYLLIDVGWRLGNLPGSGAIGKSGVSIIRDGYQHECKVKNLEIFDYSDSNVLPLKYPTNEALQEFLKQKCPTLQMQIKTE